MMYSVNAETVYPKLTILVVIKNTVNNFSPSFKGSISPNPTVEMVITVMYKASTIEYPEIKVIVAEGEEDITIKVSDEGGGIPRSGMPKMWTYLYTTAHGTDISGLENDYRAPLAGLGYGLPISRLYAKYFGGNLNLISLEGYGTDAFLHLRRLSDSEEELP